LVINILSIHDTRSEKDQATPKDFVLIYVPGTCEYLSYIRQQYLLLIIFNFCKQL